MSLGRSLVASLFVFATAACTNPAHERPSAGVATAGAASEGPPSAPEVDHELVTCASEYDALLAREAAPGAPTFDAHRPAFLARARGAPVIFVDTPKASDTSSLGPIAQAALAVFAKQPPGLRVLLLQEKLKLDKAALRAIFLREGYLYADEPDDLYNLVERVGLTDLFDAEKLYLLRGSTTRALVRAGTTRDPAYAFADGPDAGHTVSLVFGDRIAEDAASLAEPLHRDVAALADTEGFDRMKISRLTKTGIDAELRFGSTWAKAVLSSDGAMLSLRCLDAPRETRDAIALELGKTAWKRAAIANLRKAVGDGVFDANPFDHPRGFEGPDRDGELRPYWTSAYLRGASSFTDDDQTYPVYRADGRPYVPEVCVDFVLDSFERAGGSWYAPRGEPPGRSIGRLSFDSYKPENKRGVIGFGAFAESRPDLFEIRRFTGDERTPFADRAKFFDFLAKNADLFAPGDIVSIQGLKPDGRVHQHAILLERTDPLTGFPCGLADQMRLPRRRSWEGIMGEAPKRSLYYRLRPTDAVFQQIAPVDSLPSLSAP